MSRMTTYSSDAVPPRRRWLIRLKAGLDRWHRPRAPGSVLDPLVVSRELIAWAEDGSRWNRRSEADWRSLLADVERSWSKLGPRLTAAAQVSDALNALCVVRAAKSLVTADHRSAIRRAANALQSALRSPDAIAAAVDDLFDAARHSRHPESLDEETRWRLALLASICEDHGHDWAVVTDRIRRALEWNRQLPVESIAGHVRRALQVPPAQGRSVVWLAIDHASAWGTSPNPAIQLFEGDWLLSILANWSGPREGIPAELAADPRRLIDACQRVKADDAVADQLPVAFARIDLGEGLVSGARERATDILKLLVARASGQQGGTNWKINGVCLHFVDDEVIFESMLTVGEPDVYKQLTRGDILNDPTAETIRKETMRMQGHLPVADEPLHSALRLSQWLGEARHASPAARLVLSGRVIEQVAGWTNLRVPILVEDYLSWAWAWSRIAGELEQAGTAAVFRLHGADGTSSSEEEREKFLFANREIIGHPPGRSRPRAHPWRTLEHLGWLADQHPSDSEVGDYLLELHGRLTDGALSRGWIAELRDELQALNARAVRTRNAVVHGGPLIPEVAETIVEIQDNLATQALDWVTDGLSAGEDIDVVFEEHRQRYVEAFEQLRAGADPTLSLVAAAESANRSGSPI